MKTVKTIFFLIVITLVFTLRLNANVIQDEGINYQVVNLYDISTGGEIHLGQFVEVIGGAYYELENISIPSSIVYEGNEYKVIGIGDEAFAACTNLVSINIPSDVIRIGRYAFYGCDNLYSVMFPDSIHLGEIGYCAFDETPWYENLPNGIMYVGNILYKCNGKILSNEEIIIREGIEIIRKEAFEYCLTLSSITLPCSLKEIQTEAFRGCDGLTHVDIHEGVINIGDRCFWWCQKLSSIVLPQSIESIGSNVFYGCTGLKDVYCYVRKKINIHPDAFSNNLASTTLHVPITRFFIYCSSDTWNKFGKIVPFFTKDDILTLSLIVLGIVSFIGLMIKFCKKKNE